MSDALLFWLLAAAMAAPPVNPYLLVEAVASRMTNLGDCVVEGGLVGMNQKRMDELDKTDRFPALAEETAAELMHAGLWKDGAAVLQQGVAVLGIVVYAPEKVGEQLRSMMPWLAQNRLVDKSKN